MFDVPDLQADPEMPKPEPLPEFHLEITNKSKPKSDLDENEA